jgi:DNA (cytosine-5)-methyltransferase 1
MGEAEQLTQLDLCSGVGVGFPFSGIKTGGFKLIGLAEVDDYCSDILRARFPGVPNFGDVDEFAAVGGQCEQPDCVTASPPCQPFSVQGKRLAAQDSRDCFPAILRIIERCHPKFFAIENVRGLLSCPIRPGAKESYFGFLLWEFSRCGYDVEWLVISSGAVGAPYLRERLLMVGKSRRVVISGAESWAGQIREQFSQKGNPEPWASSQPDFSRGIFRDSAGMDRPIGVQSGDGITRRRRQAIGNALDPRVGAIALTRVKYLHEITSV